MQVLGVASVGGTGTSVEQELLVASWRAVPQERVQAFHAGAVAKEAGKRRDGEVP